MGSALLRTPPIPRSEPLRHAARARFLAPQVARGHLRGFPAAILLDLKHVRAGLGERMRCPDPSGVGGHHLDLALFEAGAACNVLHDERDLIWVQCLLKRHPVAIQTHKHGTVLNASGIEPGPEMASAAPEGLPQAGSGLLRVWNRTSEGG